VIGPRQPEWRGTQCASPRFASLSPRQRSMRGKGSSGASAKAARVKKLPHRWRRVVAGQPTTGCMYSILFSKSQKKRGKRGELLRCHARHQFPSASLRRGEPRLCEANRGIGHHGRGQFGRCVATFHHWRANAGAAWLRYRVGLSTHPGPVLGPTPASQCACC
jgi:hypothetical protein